ncbi:8-oxo-dGDP phosphatase NUDT18 [Periophthalmus magnuspinnatus]|uniref:8-oxo-dGDP phosphatase NUDT18 n=1 Tax=Periophthalmus magnuspinnatus TaxID=409849 RepID=UPI00145C0353|nr:8-oxo-dGDP phosphatase NUDT18 [Periophthalmus magnuspinnatus]
MEAMEEMEEQVERLLKGEGAEVMVCDMGVDQSKPATLRKNVTYIVGAVIFNDKEEVLMVQEAKSECYKQWYLPAGRVEVGESLEEALKREVKEESGFDCEPVSLLLIQEQGPQWIRFIFLASVTGGHLKTLSGADQESLQACWWDRHSSLSLRGRDILRLIDSGLKYRGDPGYPPIRPIDLSCQHVVQRLVLLYTNAKDQVWVLVFRVPFAHLPVVAAIRTHAVTWGANMVVQDAVPSSYYDHDVSTVGVMSLQHSGRENGHSDGICLNTLVRLIPEPPQRDEDGLKLPPANTERPPQIENPRYIWHEIQSIELKDKLLLKIKNTAILPLHSLY